MKVSKSIKKNIEYIKSICTNNDLVVRELFCGNKKINLVFLNEQVNDERLELYIIAPMINSKSSPKNLEEVKQKIISISETKDETDLDELIANIMKGNTILFLDGENNATICMTTKPAQRSVEEPPSSEVIYGPREGFVENIKTNLNLIRKRLPTTKLKIDELEVGRYTKSKVAICYIDDIADKKVVEKIKSRIETIDIDGILDTHYLTSYLEEKKNSIFKQVGKTEKPDIAVAKILEGRVAILVDASPVVLTLPFIFFEDLQNSDDYYQKSFRVSFTRFLRLIGLVFSIMLPGIYLAIQLYHYRIIPIKFLVTIMDSTQGITFSPFMEMLFVLILFDILFEASLRMPKYIGVAVSIVGAVVLGDTAVKAGLVSSPAVMIIALTGISFYTLPDETAQLGVLRLLFTLLGGMIGFIGIIIGSIMIIVYLVDFNAYGSPYLAPYSPYVKNDLEDGLYKKEIIAIKNRPESIPSKNKRRQK